MITERDLVIFIVAGLVGFGLRHLLAMIDRYLLDREERLADRYQRMLEEHSRASAKTDTTETEKNTLANDTEKPDNLRVNEPGSPAAPEEKRTLPFWDDPEQLRAAQSRIADNDSVATDEESLSGLLPHEAWRKIDERLLELEDTDPAAP